MGGLASRFHRAADLLFLRDDRRAGSLDLLLDPRASAFELVDDLLRDPLGDVADAVLRGARPPADVGASLASSSGSSVLDGEALALVRRASPIPAPPEGVGGRTLSLTVPVSM